MATFKDVFPEGNVSEIELDGWECEKCGESLEFQICIDNCLIAEYRAECCGISYLIQPYAACYVVDKPAAGPENQNPRHAPGVFVCLKCQDVSTSYGLL